VLAALDHEGADGVAVVAGRGPVASGLAAAQVNFGKPARQEVRRHQEAAVELGFVLAQAGGLGAAGLGLRSVRLADNQEVGEISRMRK